MAYKPDACSVEELTLLSELCKFVSDVSIKSAIERKSNYKSIVDSSIDVQRVVVRLKTFCSRVQYQSSTVYENEELIKEHDSLVLKLKDNYEKFKQEIK